MARITVEDCIDKFPSRFELVLIASQRARKLHSGELSSLEKDNDKNTVIALREIADSTFTIKESKEKLIQEYQTVTMHDEEEENIELESINSDEDDKIAIEKEDSVAADKTDLIASEDAAISEKVETDNVLESDKISITENLQEEIEPISQELQKNDDPIL